VIGLIYSALCIVALGPARQARQSVVLERGAGNNGHVSTAKASSFLNAAGTMGG
jgi:hypothetical protein